MAHKSMLIVDDVEFTLEFEKMVILSLEKELGIEIRVDTAGTVQEALQKLAATAYDALIVDMNLPDGSGTQIALEGLTLQPSLQIAALTVYPQHYEQHKTLFKAFFLKPILPATYKENVKWLLEL